MSGVAHWSRGAGASTNGPVIGSSGSLYLQKGGTSQSAPHTTPGDGDLNLSVDASRSSALFGASDTVQVSGLFAQCLIRYE